MAFGSTLSERPVRTAVDGESTQTYEYQWIPLNGGNKKDRLVKGGNRKIRMLPELDANRKLVLDGDGNTVPATENRFLEVWVDVNLGGQTVPRRIILDWRRQFDNPYWNMIAEPTPPKSPQRKAQRHKFAMNVVDLTPVLQDAEGRYVYPDENGVYQLSAQGKFVEPITGRGTPLRKVRILESTAGDKGGRHFLQQLITQITGVEDGDGEPRQAHEVDLLISITGIDVDTQRPIRTTANFSPLPDELIYAPRYNLAEWTKPWPDEAVTLLLQGADFNEVIEQFGITLFPSLEDLTTPEVVVKKATKKAKASDEPLFD